MSVCNEWEGVRLGGAGAAVERAAAYPWKDSMPMHNRALLSAATLPEWHVSPAVPRDEQGGRAPVHAIFPALSPVCVMSRVAGRLLTLSFPLFPSFV